MPSKMELLLEAERRGLLPPEKLAALNEARGRGLVPGAAPAAPAEAVTPIAAPAEVELTAQPAQQSFSERMGVNLEERGEQAKDILAAMISGEQSIPESALQGVFGVGGGIASDIIGEGLTSGMRGLSAITPDFIEDPVSRGGAYALKQIGSIPSFGGGTIGEGATSALRSIGSGIGEFQEEHPRAARNLAALGHGVEMVPVGKGLAMAGKAAAPTVKAGAKSAKEIIAKIPRPTKAMSASQIKDNASLFYKQADEIGGAIDAPKINKLFKDIKDDILPKDKIDLDAAKVEPFYKELDSLDKLYNKDQPLTLTNLTNMDQKLSSSIERMAKEGTRNDQRLLQKAQTKLRELMDEQPGDAFKLYNEGRKRYAQSKRVEIVENAMRRSESMQQPSSALARKLNTLKDDIIEGKQRGFTDAELKLIEKAGKTGLVQGGLRGAGSRLVGGAALTSGLTAAPFTGGGSALLGAGAAGGSIAARKAADALRRRAARGAIKGIQPQQLSDPMQYLKLYQGQ
jgi:hypothetical protein